MELVGVHPTCLLKKTQSSFEEAHHWNIQAKFYSVKVPTQLYACMIISMEYKYDNGVRVWIFQKEQQCAPFSLFIFFFSFFSFFIFLWPQWLFLFNSHLSSLGSFNFVLFGIFSSLQGQHSIYYKKYRRSFTLYKSTQHKEDELS